MQRDESLSGFGRGVKEIGTEHLHPAPPALLYNQGKYAEDSWKLRGMDMPVFD